MGPHDGTDVEELVTVTNVVKATRGQTFGEMRSKEETGPESKEEVIKMKGDGFIPVATFSVAEKEPVEQRDVVKDEGVHKSHCAQNFT